MKKIRKDGWDFSGRGAGERFWLKKQKLGEELTLDQLSSPWKGGLQSLHFADKDSIE